jgi:23S rRNA (guanosine2251-2'-O)-methyltransferase
MEALQAGKEVESIYIQEGLNNPLVSELKFVIKQKNFSYKTVPSQKLNKLTAKNHQGVVAFLSLLQYHRIEDVIPFVFESGKTPLILLLDGITDVRNFGAIARSAACAGADAIVIPAQGSAQVNADAVKTSAGALFKIPVCKEKSLKHAIEFLKLSGLTIYAATEKAQQTIYTSDFKNPCCIILGSEEGGISSSHLKLCDAQIKIPMEGDIASLNVSVASAVILFEAVRQRLAMTDKK